LLIVPLLAAVATFVQSKMAIQPMRADMSAQEKSMQSMSKNMAYFFPGMIFLFSLNFAQGIGLYWVTQNLYMILQQYYMVGWGGLHLPAWMPGAGRTTSLSHPGHRPQQQTVPTAGIITTKSKLVPVSGSSTPTDGSGGGTPSNQQRKPNRNKARKRRR
jgi:hypothetical protein